MDTTTADVVKSLGGSLIQWGALAVIVLIMFFASKQQVWDRIKNLRRAPGFEFGSPASQESQPVGTPSIGSAPADASSASEGMGMSEVHAALPGSPERTIRHAEGELPKNLTPETEDLVRRLVSGWRFERTLRIIYTEQVALMREIADKKTIDDKEAMGFYNRTAEVYRKGHSLADFMAYLFTQKLVMSSPVNGGILYSLTVDGTQFLRYVDALTAGVAWPGVSDVMKGYKWGSDPLPKMLDERRGPTLEPPADPSI